MRNCLAALLPTLLLLTFTASGQDAVFSQFYAAPVRLNPALTGISTASRITMNYRAQHTSYPSAFTTLAASFEQPVYKTPSSFGLRMLSDRHLEGAYRNTDIALIYSYDIQFTKVLHARLGISAGILNTSLDFNRLVFGDVLDPINGQEGITQEQLESSARTAADVGAGIILYGGPYYGGISFEHLNRPSENVLQLNDQVYAGRPLRFTLTGGAQIDLESLSTKRRAVYITPNLLYTSQARFRQINLGAYFGYGPVALGGWYRHAFENADALIASVSFRQDIVRIGFSYDAVTSELASVPGGLGATFEVSLVIDFGQSEKLQRSRFRSRYSECFRMFQ